MLNNTHYPSNNQTNDTESEPYVDALSTGSYIIINAMLADATQNQSYLDLGHKSEEFYYNQLRNSQGDLLDGRNAYTCISPSEVTGPTNAVGTIIEGLAIVFALSKRDNTSTKWVEYKLLPLYRLADQTYPPSL
ncbi:hypothetical protein AAF712_000919 [Marasmius tenuissimus]|uniref:Uncharacterized protein n=1 Tax=Marasmius tenuissimus TaxID=585030 RepID=A0ABR3ADM2_9AGAR